MKKQKKEKKIKVVKEEDYNEKTIEWEKSVTIVRWEHDIENGIYNIQYSE